MKEEKEKQPKLRLGRFVRKLLDWIARGQSQGGLCKS
jgi:hypothetical protein